MTPSFKTVNFEHKYDLFVKFRKAAHFEVIGTDEIDEVLLRKYINNNIDIFGKSAFLHMYLEDVIIGQMEMGTKFDSGYVHLFYLHPAFRQKGYFRHMHEKMVSIMKEKNFSTVMLATLATHKNLIQLYEKYRWVLCTENCEKQGMVYLKLSLPND